MPPSNSIAPIWPAVVDATGVLHLDRRIREAMTAYVRTNLKNTPVELVIRKVRKDRSSPQVAYYFAVVIPMFAQHEGYRTDEQYMLHDGLMHKFWPLEPDKVTHAPRRRRLSLKEQGTEPPLSDEEMGIHIEQVVMFAAERGCVIPDADKEYRVTAKSAKSAKSGANMRRSYRVESKAA